MALTSDQRETVDALRDASTKTWRRAIRCRWDDPERLKLLHQANLCAFRAEVIADGRPDPLPMGECGLDLASGGTCTKSAGHSGPCNDEEGGR